MSEASRLPRGYSRKKSAKGIPGLDHCLTTEGEWVPTAVYLFTHNDYRDQRNLARRIKVERRSVQTGRQITLW